MVDAFQPAIDLSRSPLASARWLILAPHADDETLGAGALIADAARRNVLAGVAILTDGAGSHSHDGPVSRARLIATRRREAALAVRRLTEPRSHSPLFLNWPDAHPAKAGQLLFETARRRLVALCRARRVDAIAVTAAHEPHCDHEAAFILASTVARTAMRPLHLYEYMVWAPTPPLGIQRVLRAPPMPTGLRGRALAAHASQLTNVLGRGFRLPDQQRRMSPSDLLYLRIHRDAPHE